jgi:hypothetical protein
MVKEIQLRVNLIEEKKENILLYKASKKLEISPKLIIPSPKFPVNKQYMT